MSTNISPTYDSLMSLLIQIMEAEKKLNTIAIKPDKCIERADVIDDAKQLLTVDIPSYLTKLFELLKMDIPADSCTQVFELKTGFVCNVLTPEGAVQLLKKDPDAVKMAFREKEITTTNLGRFQDVSNCCKDVLAKVDWLCLSS